MIWFRTCWVFNIILVEIRGVPRKIKNRVVISSMAPRNVIMFITILWWVTERTPLRNCTGNMKNKRNFSRFFSVQHNELYYSVPHFHSIIQSVSQCLLRNLPLINWPIYVNVWFSPGTKSHSSTPPAWQVPGNVVVHWGKSSRQENVKWMKISVPAGRRGIKTSVIFHWSWRL